MSVRALAFRYLNTVSLCRWSEPDRSEQFCKSRQDVFMPKSWERSRRCRTQPCPVPAAVFTQGHPPLRAVFAFLSSLLSEACSRCGWLSLLPLLWSTTGPWCATALS